MVLRFSSRSRVCGPVALTMLAGVLLASCALFGDDAEGVKVRSNGLVVTIANDTGDRIFYNIFGAELATRIDWISHLDEESSVAGGKSRVIPYADIMKEDGETEAIVYWWGAVIRDGERVPGPITSARVGL